MGIIQQEQLKHISSYTSKLLRSNFGRGPESCRAYLESDMLLIFCRGFISPMEETLLQEEQFDSVAMSRNIIIKKLLYEIRGAIHLTFETDVEGFYHDWSYENNVGVILAVLSRDNNSDVPIIPTDENNSVSLALLEKEVIRISEIVQKVPDYVECFQITPKIIVVIRTGIFIMIEKALIKKGYSEQLRATKSELEKQYFHSYGKYDQIFKNDVEDILIDWSFKDNKSMICFLLK